MLGSYIIPPKEIESTMCVERRQDRSVSHQLLWGGLFELLMVLSLTEICKRCRLVRPIKPKRHWEVRKIVASYWKVCLLYGPSCNNIIIAKKNNSMYQVLFSVLYVRIQTLSSLPRPYKGVAVILPILG